MSMLLSADTIRLGARPANKSEAIELAGLVLADSGHIEHGYIRSMMEREKQANTFLGHGIAIPHGMAPDRHMIKETGVAVVQVPDGVEWNKNERVDLIVAIAAKSDEHLKILASLMDVMDDEALIQRLTQTTSVDEIAAALNGAGQSFDSQFPAIEGPSIEARIAGHAGLHARPATKLVELAAQFKSDIYLEYKGQRASTKSTVSLLKLGIGQGER
ncbi:HPr family phosphocarrier protein, partial [bacterium]